MLYLKLFLILMIFYLLPFTIVGIYLCLLIFLNPPMDSGFGDMAYFVLAFILYCLVYFIRTLLLVIIGILSLINYTKYTKILKNNTLILVALIIIDLIMIKFITISSYAYIIPEDGLILLISFLLCTLSGVYLPLWVIYGLRNVVCCIRNWIKRTLDVKKA